LNQISNDLSVRGEGEGESEGRRCGERMRVGDLNVRVRVRAT